MIPVGSSTVDMQAGKLTTFVFDAIKQHVSPKCTSFGIVHQGDEGSQLMTTRAVPKKLSEDEHENLAQDFAHLFYAEARQDVSTHQRAQRYYVIAFANGDQVLCRFPLLLYPSVDRQLGASSESEPANATGLISHAMRHHEVGMRLALGHTNGLMERISEENQQLRARCSQLEDKNFAMLEKHEALISKQFERDLAFQREKRQDERLERLFLQVEKIVPMIAAKYVPQLTAASPTPDAAEDPVAAIIHFFMGLSTKQKEDILAVLTEEQKGQFGSVIQGCITAMQQKQQTKGKAA